MDADIKLESEELTLEGDRVRVSAFDLLIDSPIRRGTKAPDSPRRALVHDEADGLTVNFNGDYPGGLNLHGLVTVRDRARVRGQLHIFDDLLVTETFEAMHSSVDSHFELIKNAGPGTVAELRPGTADRFAPKLDVTYSLIEQVHKLTAAVEHLQGELALLKARLPPSP